MSSSVLVVAAYHFKTKQEQDNEERRFGCDSKPKLGYTIDVFLQGHHGPVIQRERISVLLTTGRRLSRLIGLRLVYAA